MADAPGNNDRITQAILKQVVENNTKALERIDKRLDAIDVCIRNLENRMTRVETRQDNIDDDIDRLSRKSDGWSVFNSALAAIAMYLGWK